jgi:thiol-disulfide isomerase/thioredoxin
VTRTNDSHQQSGSLRSDQNQLIFDRGFSFSGYERDALYMNMQGKKFMDISGISGIDSITDGRAAVFADFDNDGDYDVFLTTIQNQAHLLFRNNVGQENNWLRISLEGDKEVGRDAYGAVVRVRTSAGILTKIKAGGSGFLSQHDPRLLFGLGQDGAAQTIEVTWPNGKVEAFAGDVTAGSSLLLRKGTGKAEALNLARTSLPNPLTAAEALAAKLKIQPGKPMPDLVLSTLDGTKASLRDKLRKGGSTLINVWATWCAPCIKEMPELENLRAELNAHNVGLIGLNVDTDPQAKVGQFLQKTGVTYPIFLGGVPAVESMYLTDELMVPLSIVVGPDGIVRELISGWSAGTRHRFQVLAGGAGKN